MFSRSTISMIGATIAFKDMDFNVSNDHLRHRHGFQADGNPHPAPGCSAGG
jgi:hypothetical protein